MDQTATVTPGKDRLATPPALSIRGLTKRYADGTIALEDLDLEIPDGSFFGLLGPNGAGKNNPDRRRLQPDPGDRREIWFSASPKPVWPPAG